MTRVLIADDQPRARRSLHALLTAIRWRENGGGEHDTHEIELVGEADDGQQTILQAEALQPDEVIMVSHMPKMQALTTIVTMKYRWRDFRTRALGVYA